MRPSLLAPPALKKGDTIAIVATAYAIDYTQIEVAVKLLENWGLVVWVGETIGERDGIFAGDDLLRTKDLQAALDDATIKAILFARGGYGTVRIIDNLDFTKFMRSPKWICGYSDITVLHTHINNTLAVQTIHSTMPVKFATTSEASLDSFRNALFGAPLSYEFDSHPMNQVGKITSIMHGGNLSILYSLTGTSTTFSTQNKMLFLEDVDEYLYHIDRMMMNLKRANKFKQIDAVLIGGFSDLKDNVPMYKKSVESIILEYFDQQSLPICFNVPCGHIDDNRTLIFGRKCTLEITKEKTRIDFGTP